MACFCQIVFVGLGEALGNAIIVGVIALELAYLADRAMDWWEDESDGDHHEYKKKTREEKQE